jgi:hypothetical protein
MGRLQNNPLLEWVHPKSTLAPALAFEAIKKIKAL